jgi:peptide/nickel transport system permease protein
LLLALLGAVALLAPVLAPGDPFAAAGPPLVPPGQGYLLGTDDLGRDLWALVVHGSRTSLLVGLSVAGLSGSLAILIGALAGYQGGRVDDLLMRLAELVQVLPRALLVLVAAVLFGPSFGLIALLLGLTLWPLSARVLRAQVLALREREFVIAARALGATDERILSRHVLPNALPVVLPLLALQVGNAILIEAALSFLGLGDRGLVSWGYLLNAAQPFLRTAWWMAVFPGMATALLVLAVLLTADHVAPAAGAAPP